jgi:cytochrome c553
MPALRILAAVALSGAALSAPAAENTKVTLQNKLAQCQGCHGIEGWKTAYPEVYHVPKLGGQKAAYIVNALKEYKSGDRDFGTMHAMVMDLTDQDMQELAKYFEGHGNTASADNSNPAPGGK